VAVSGISHGQRRRRHDRGAAARRRGAGGADNQREAEVEKGVWPIGVLLERPLVRCDSAAVVAGALQRHAAVDLERGLRRELVGLSTLRFIEVSLCIDGLREVHGLREVLNHSLDEHSNDVDSEHTPCSARASFRDSGHNPAQQHRGRDTTFPYASAASRNRSSLSSAPASRLHACPSPGSRAAASRKQIAARRSWWCVCCSSVPTSLSILPPGYSGHGHATCAPARVNPIVLIAFYISLLRGEKPHVRW